MRESIGAVLNSPASSSLGCEIDTWCRQTDVNFGLELALTFCLQFLTVIWKLMSADH